LKLLEHIYGRPIVANPDAPADDPEGINPFADPTCEACHGFGFVRRNVPIHHEDFGKAIPCSCAAGAIRQKRISRMEARIPYSDEGYTFDNYPREGDQRALALARAFALQDTGSLFLWGGVRVGKTSLASCIGRERLKRADDVLFLTVPDLIEEFKRTFDHERGELTTSQLTDLVRDTTLVVFDDIGAEHVTGWVLELLYRLINHRQTQRKRTVYTSNKSLRDLELRLDERIAWRIKAHCEPDGIVKVAGQNLNDREVA
jgi:DNA replication protein DnaC